MAAPRFQPHAQLHRSLAEACVQPLAESPRALSEWERSGTPETLEPVRALFHRVAGAGGLLGLRELSAMAATGEDLTRLLQEGAAGSSAGRLLVILRRHLEVLEAWSRAELQAAPEPSAVDFPFMAGPALPPLPPRDDDGADLPFHASDAPPPPPPSAFAAESELPHPDDVPRRVLVVDDDPVSAAVMLQALESAGMSVRHCADGREALELYERTAPDVVLMDLDMPGQDGFTTCRQLRAHVDGDRAPILVVSKSTDVEAKVKALEAGADDYLTKPFAPAELRARILAHALRYELQREQAFRDPLTGAWNRRYLERVLAQRLPHAAGAPFCLALLDVDHFKQVNDLHGHPAGDDVLVTLVERIRGLLRAEDLVARIGGDELAVLVSGAALERGVEVINRVAEAVRGSPIPLRGGLPPVEITVSAGVTAAQLDDAPAQLFDRADHALYASKRAGRNRVSPG